MKIIRFLLIFTSAFLLAWILIFTFIQPPFKVPAAAKVLVWDTPAIPIYLYVAGAFLLGLAVGVVISLVNYLALSANLRRVQHECAELKGKLAAEQLPVPAESNNERDEIPPLFGDGLDSNVHETGDRP